MKRLFRAIFVLCLAAFLFLNTVPVASAQPAGPFYVGVFGGLVVPDDLEFYYYRYGSSYDDDVDDSWTIGAKFGYIFPQVYWLAAELEYTYLADQDYGQTFSSADNYDGNFSAHNVMANLLFRYPQGKIHPYVGFGLGISKATIEESGNYVRGGTVYSYDIDEDDTAIASQFIAGVNFEITPNISAELAYKYFYSEYELDYDVDLDHGNHLFTVGVNYHF